MSVADDRNLEKRLKALERAVAKSPLGRSNGGGGGGGGVEYYERSSEASLPNDASVGSKAFARTTDDPAGGFFVRNETDDGWFCLTHWR